MSIPPVSPQSFVATPFDYLIVGGGTAGLVLASRLTENLRITVGVLEAGPAVLDSPAIRVPGRYGETLGTDLDWQFETVPQPRLADRKLPWPRGKLLGGTSALNFMTWNRPSREDLDAWEALGNKGWGWDSMLPFYKKSERFYEPVAAHQENNKSYHDKAFLGTDGPIPIVYTDEYSTSHQHWHKTLNSLGVNTNKSHFSGSNVGVWTNIVSVQPETCTRADSTSSYYLPNAHRKNLTVLTGALARELVTEQVEGKWTAKGVRFVCGDEEFTATVSKEVLVAGGSISSPQLLELSGIGDPELLKAAGIAVKVPNKNVGENLQDHIMTASIYEVDSSLASPDDLRLDTTAAAAADEAYALTKTGPRTILPCSICYLLLSHFLTPGKLKELGSQAAAIASSAPSSQHKAQIRAERLTKAQRLGQIEYIFDIGNWSPFLHPEPGKKYGTMLQILQYPFSVGSVHVSRSEAESTPPTSYVKPDIDPRFYSGAGGEIDFEVMRLGLAFGDEIANTAPLSGLIKKRASPKEAGDEDRREWLADNTVMDWHPVGTCGMGGSEGMEGGVVDERLGVYGVKGLRVVDASIMPLQISAHLQATVYAIAEKGAAMVLEDGGWG